jgi:hypothetical protein
MPSPYRCSPAASSTKSLGPPPSQVKGVEWHHTLRGGDLPLVRGYAPVRDGPGARAV